MAQQMQQPMQNKQLQPSTNAMPQKQLGQEPPSRPHNRVGESVQANPTQTAKQIEQQILQATETKMENKGVYRKTNNMRNMLSPNSSFGQLSKNASQAAYVAQKAHEKDVIMRTSSANAAEDALKNAHNTVMFDEPKKESVSPFGFDSMDTDKKTTPKKSKMPKQAQATPVVNESSKTLNPYDFKMEDDVIPMGENNIMQPTSTPVEKGITHENDYANNAGAFMMKTNKQSNFVKFLQTKQADILVLVGDKLGVSDEPSFATKQHVYIEPSKNTKDMTSCRIAYSGFDEVNVKKVDEAVRSVIKDVMTESGETNIFMDKTTAITNKDLSVMAQHNVSIEHPIHMNEMEHTEDISLEMAPLETQKEVTGLSM